jgi:hypothetical protein
MGILSFNASANSISTGESVTLAWETRDVLDAAIYPGIGSVMAQTDANGIGSIIISPIASTTYTLIVTNATTIYTNYVAIMVDHQPLFPCINEIMADNRLTLKDGNNNASDWIELFNPADQPLNLSGYGLSDDPATPQKWTFPPVLIPAYGYLIVYASGEDDSYDDEGNLHASWKLSAAGESVVLTAPDGVTTVDCITNFPAQAEDLAYGRDLNGELKFLEPTPGFPNHAIAYEGWLAPLTFSHSRGFYTNSFNLYIPLHTRGAKILYSLDGSEPTMPYSSSMSISGTTTFRARITKAGYKSPRTQTASYIFIDDVIISDVMNQSIAQDPQYADRLKSGMMDLPTLTIAVPQLPDDYIKCEASVEILWPDGKQPIQANCGMVRFGGAYTTFAKKNYRLKFSAKYGTTKLEAPLFEGMDHGFPVSSVFDELELGGGSHDMKDRGFYMSARFVEDSMLDMGSINPHGCFAHVYINGVYWGQFHLRERLVENFLADNLGGKPEEYFNVRGNDNYGSSFVLGTPDPLCRDLWRRVRNLQNSYHDVKPYLDVSHLIDFNLLWTYGYCESEYRAAGPVDAGTGFKFWMADSDGFLRLTGDRTATTGPSNLFGTLNTENDPDYKILLADRIYKHYFNDGALTPTATSARLANRMDEIQDSLIAECARWGYRTPDTWVAAAENIQLNMFPVRTSQQISYLKNRGLYPTFDPPAFDQRGGLVPEGHQPVLSTSTGTIYYTLDGSDPRLPGGEISSNALVYSSDTSSSTMTLIPAGAQWRYLDDGSDQGSAWYANSFDDTAWAAGAAELGYGDGQTTTVSYGPDSSQKYTTTYFRHTFPVSDSSELLSLTLNLLRDDGAIVYLNGTEVVRDNLPATGVDYTTLTLTSVNGDAESTFYSFAIPVTLLQNGDNVLAVEIHQTNLTTSDLSFNLELTAALPENAVEPNSALVLSNDTVITTRLLNDGEWSALESVPFLMMGRAPASAENLAITEIHYNPDGDDEYEFIEIYNCGTNIADLSGVAFDDGVSFEFPAGLGIEPGEFLVVVEDSTAFEERYQNAVSTWYYPEITVVGQWSGALNNDGETVVLTGSNGVAIASIPYSPDGVWPGRADSGGSSLELRDIEALPSSQPERDVFLSNGDNWRSSSLYHGSPGRFDNAPRTLFINEVLSHTDLDIDWIELHNSSTGVVDISGLYLSDSSSNLLRFEIPDSPEVQPGGYASISATNLGFGFSELGSDATLVEAAGSDLIRFIDTVDFPAAEREEPFGRYLKSDGSTDFTELITVTRDAANALPRVGPVVFSEIMYHPATGMTEYVELVNITGSSISLYDVNEPDNTWELEGAVTYAFPPGMQLPSHTPLIVCATNPAAFRLQYAVGPGITVLGPWAGALNNAGELLKLRRPGDPEPGGFVPYYRVDRVHYTPLSPWPIAADSGGISLVRISSGAYGNDPGSWTVLPATSSPGVIDFNCPPVWQPIPNLFHPVGLSFTFDLSAYVSDPNMPSQNLSYAQSGLPQGLSLNPDNGLISGVHSNQGPYGINLMASDNQAPPLNATNGFMLTFTEPFHMQIGGVGSGVVQLSFPTINGESYAVEVSDTLTPPNWTLLQYLPDIETNLWQINDLEASSHTQRFYRVFWLQD